MKKLNNVKQWIKNHKTDLIIAGFGGVVSGFMAYKLGTEANTVKGILRNKSDEVVVDGLFEITKDKALQLIEEGQKYSLEEFNGSNVIWID